MVPASSIPPPLPPSLPPGPNPRPAPKTQWGLVIFAASAAILILGRFIFAGWYVAKRVQKIKDGPPIEPEVEALLHSLETEPVNLDHSVYKVDPLPDALLAKVRVLEALWREVEFDPSLMRLLQKIPKKEGPFKLVFSEEEWNQIAELEMKLSEKSASLLPLYMEILRDPDSRFEALVLGTNLPFPNIDMNGGCESLLATKIHLLLRGGGTQEVQEALELATDYACFASVHRYSPLLTQRIAMRFPSGGVALLSAVLPYCTESESLHKTLDRLSNLKALSTGFIQHDIPLPVSDAIGYGVLAGYLGYDVHFNGKTGFEIIAEGWLANAEILENQILPTIHDDPERLESVTNSINFAKQSAYRLSPESEGIHARRFYQSVSVITDDQYAYISEKRVLTKLDLARIEVARRLYALEHHSEAKSWETLVPEYFAEKLTDRFQTEGTPMSVTEVGLFYSFGPDGDDDHAQTLDSSHSVDEPADGDIFLSITTVSKP